MKVWAKGPLLVRLLGDPLNGLNDPRIEKNCLERCSVIPPNSVPSVFLVTRTTGNQCTLMERLVVFSVALFTPMTVTLRGVRARGLFKKINSCWKMYCWVRKINRKTWKGVLESQNVYMLGISVHFAWKNKQCVFQESNHPFHVSSPSDVHSDLLDCTRPVVGTLWL